MDPTSANLIVFFTGLKTLFFGAYSETEVWAPKISMEVPSDTELETYGWMDRLPAMRQWTGPRVVNAVPTRSRSLVNLDWEQTESLPRNKFLDDKFGLFNPLAQEMGRQAKKNDDYQLASILESNPVGFDGVTFFSTAHPIDIDAGAGGPLGSQSNDLTTLALNVSDFGTARSAMRAFQGRDGKPFGAKPTLLVVPTQLEEAALQLQKASFFAPQTFGNSATNVGATENIWKGAIDVLVIPELTHPKIWYLFDCSGYVKPLLVQKRQAVNFVYLVNPNDPNVFWQKEFVWGADSRSAYDVGIYWLALRCGAGL
jgi:phage major head subunit gpT-like protein